MAIPHAKPGEVIDVQPLAAALATAKTSTLLKTDATPRAYALRLFR